MIDDSGYCKLVVIQIAELNTQSPYLESGAEQVR